MPAEGDSNNHLNAPPPKPKRLHRRTPPITIETTEVVATEATPTNQESTESEDRTVSSVQYLGHIT